MSSYFSHAGSRGCICALLWTFSGILLNASRPHSFQGPSQVQLHADITSGRPRERKGGSPASEEQAHGSHGAHKREDRGPQSTIVNMRPAGHLQIMDKAAPPAPVESEESAAAEPEATALAATEAYTPYPGSCWNAETNCSDVPAMFGGCHHRIGSWVNGKTKLDAAAACNEDLSCRGYHWSEQDNSYVLVDLVGPPFGPPTKDPNHGEECYVKPQKAPKTSPNEVGNHDKNGLQARSQMHVEAAPGFQELAQNVSDDGHLQALNVVSVHQEHLHSTRELQKKTATREGWCLISSCAFAVVGVLSLVLGHELLEAQGIALRRKHRSHRSIMVVACFGEFLRCMNYTVLIPISLDLIRATGFGAMTSGVFLSAFPACSFCGTMLAFLCIDTSSLANLRRSVMLSSICVAACNVAFACAVLCSSLQSTKLLAVMMTCRMVAGALSAGNAFALQRTALKCTPPGEAVDFFVARRAVISLAYGAGPLLGSSTMLFGEKLFGKQLLGSEIALVPPSVFMQSSAPLCMIAVALCIHALFVSAIIPSSWDAEEAGEARPPEEVHPGEEPCIVPPLGQEEERKCLLMTFYFYICVYTAMIVAVDVSTAFILEDEFGWSPRDIGFGIGLVLTSTAVPGLVFVTVRGSAVINELFVMGMLCSFLFFGALLFFTFCGRLYPGRPEFLLFCADFIIYTCGHSLSGVLEGMACKATMPGTSFSLEHFLAMKSVLGNLGQLLSAPCARGIISYVSRDAYAGTQLLLVLLSCLCSSRIISFSLPDKK